tara:strand:- start:248 stop:745 length:498 start_codon:yes stop_codon:yes gene_type:complete
MNLEILANKMQIKYYSNLIKYSKKSNSKYELFLQKYNELNDLNDTLTESEVIKLSNNDNLENNDQVNQNNSSESQEIVYSDDYLYKRPWTKLSNIHKIIKLKEFISKLLIDDQDEKDNLKKQIVKLVHCKVLTKKDKVKYDSVKGRVIAIPILTYKNNKYQIKKS